MPTHNSPGGVSIITPPSGMSAASPLGGVSTPSSISSTTSTRVEADISSTDYARRRRELMDMMADLRFMG